MAEKLKATERFLESWLNKDHYVLGYNLKPFCLYYQHCLEAVESPIWYFSDLSFEDLEIACKICSSKFDTLSETLKPSWLSSFSYRRRIKKYDLKTELTKFDNYLKDHLEPPEIWDKKNEIKKKSSGIPAVLSIAARIEMSTGWDEEKIWMMPWGKAIWRATAYAKISGIVDVDVRTDEDIEIEKQLEDMELLNG